MTDRFKFDLPQDPDEQGVFGDKRPLIHRIPDENFDNILKDLKPNTDFDRVGGPQSLSIADLGFTLQGDQATGFPGAEELPKDPIAELMARLDAQSIQRAREYQALLIKLGLPAVPLEEAMDAVKSTKRSYRENKTPRDRWEIIDHSKESRLRELELAELERQERFEARRREEEAERARRQAIRDAERAEKEAEEARWREMFEARRRERDGILLRDESKSTIFNSDLARYDRGRSDKFGY